MVPGAPETDRFRQDHDESAGALRAKAEASGLPGVTQAYRSRVALTVYFDLGLDGVRRRYCRASASCGRSSSAWLHMSRKAS